MGVPVSRRTVVGAIVGGVAGLHLPGTLRATRQDVASPSSTGSRTPEWMVNDSVLPEVNRWLELATVPGLGVGVWEAGESQVRGFGFARAEIHARVDELTVFEGASLGKPICAWVTLRLVNQGLIDLDKPLDSYAPLAPEERRGRILKVTARHVLSQSTGLPNWRTEPGPLVCSSDPGKAFTYSGEGYFWLQRALEQASGKPFCRIVRDELLEPAGMKDSGYTWREAYEKRMAWGYDTDGKHFDVYAAIGRRLDAVAKRWVRNPDDWKVGEAEQAVKEELKELKPLPCYAMPNAAGSFITTVDDYLKFMQHILVNRDRAIGLPEHLWRAMVTPWTRVNSAVSWGLGWGLQQDDWGDALWHFGSNGTFRNFALIDVRRGRGVVVLTNSANGRKLYPKVIGAITRHDHPAFLFNWV